MLLGRKALLAIIKIVTGSMKMLTEILQKGTRILESIRVRTQQKEKYRQLLILIQQNLDRIELRREENDLCIKIQEVEPTLLEALQPFLQEEKAEVLTMEKTSQLTNIKITLQSPEGVQYVQQMIDNKLLNYGVEQPEVSCRTIPTNRNIEKTKSNTLQNSTIHRLRGIWS